MSVAKRFAATLRAERQRAGLDQEELARRSGLAQSEVGRLEAGEESPRLSTMVKLADGLDAPLERLVARM